MDGPALQERFTPESRCFVCGPANEKGLRIRSFPEPGTDAVVCGWTASPHHASYPGVLNGGVASALLDCHANWAAVAHLMGRDGLSAAPATVTARLSVSYRLPVPSDRSIRLWARALASKGNSVEVEGKILVDGKAAVVCTARIVAVGGDRPAFRGPKPVS